MRLGIIGTGYWGRNHVRVASELLKAGTLKEVTVCDMREDIAKELADRYELPYVTDVEQMRSRVDGVIIATPSPSHYPLASQFIADGTHVLVEKPLTLTAADGKKLVAEAEQSDALLMVGHLFRHHPGVIALKERMDRRDLGEIQYIMSERSAFRAPRPDMGVNFALNIHEVDLFCHLLGTDYPRRIFATQRVGQIEGIEEAAQIHMDFGSCQASAFASWMTPIRGKVRTLTVVGSERSAMIDYLKPEELHLHDARIYRRDGVLTQEDNGGRTVSLPHKEPLKEEVLNFIAAAAGSEATRSDMNCGLRAVEMIEAAFQSVKEGRWIPLSGAQE